ncbi:WD repeat-containing protein 91-like [Patiria miniata]|uniref:WD repeat-containing protein 91 n=1 Tax=Patiria miniata TaxID=46514 RepID=A0A914B5D9_PATMI|nr:WD repeat-containing protein 91-like [Patiria miniata]
MADAVERTDDLVRDYLLFRGFTNTLKTFDAELKVDKDKKLRVDKVLDHLLNSVWNYDLAAVRGYMEHLDRRIFSHLEYSQMTNVRKLEVSILRLYIVNASQNNRSDKVSEFFEKMGSEIQNQPEWKEWFALPFLKNPEQSATFELYFSKQWQETLTISLHNFFSIIFQSMPLPGLLNFDAELQRMNDLQDNNALLMKQVSMLERAQKEKGASLELPSELSGAAEVQDDFTALPTNAEVKDPQFKAARVSSTKKSPSPISVRRSNPLGTPGPARRAVTAILGSVSDKVTRQVGNGRESGTSKKAEITQAASSGISVQGFNQMSQPSQQPATHQRPGRSQQQSSQALAQQRRELLSKSSQGRAPDSQRYASQSSVEEYGMQDMLSVGKPGRSGNFGTLPNFAEPVALEPVVKKEPDVTVPKALPQPVAVPIEETKKPSLDQDYEEAAPFIVLSQDEYTEHHSAIAACKFNPSATTVASLDIDGVVKVWKFAPSPITTATIMYKSPVLSIEWATKSDRLLLLGSSNGTVKIYDTEAKKPVCDLETDSGHPRAVSLCCSPNGSTFICSAASLSNHQPSGLPSTAVSSRLLVCDIKQVKVINELAMTTNSGCVNCTAFNHNGHLLVTGAADGMIRIFDMQRLESLLSWHAHSGPVYAAQFSLDETSVLSMGSDGKFSQWSTHRVGERLQQLDIHDGATGPFIMSGFGGYKQQLAPRAKLFAFDSSGTHVLTCAPYGGIIYKLHREQGMLRLLTILGHRTPVVSVDWCTSVNTGMCLTGSMDGRVQVTTLLSQ